MRSLAERHIISPNAPSQMNVFKRSISSRPESREEGEGGGRVCAGVGKGEEE